MNFRDLVDRAARYKDPTKRPRSMGAMAIKCGVSRPHLYNLIRGDKIAQPWTIARIAKGLSLDDDTVRRALEVSREEGGR